MLGKAYQVVANTVTAMVEGFRAYRLYHRSYRELAALDDRQLQDIGISRSMIRTVAVTGAHRANEVGVWDSSLVSNREQSKYAA